MVKTRLVETTHAEFGVEHGGKCNKSFSVEDKHVLPGPSSVCGLFQYASGFDQHVMKPGAEPPRQSGHIF